MISITKEEIRDYRTVEELTREAFWNVHVPGCDEHYYLHLLRLQPSFIPELSYVARLNGVIVGHIAYMESRVGDVVTLTFGPVSVVPHKQGQGIGSELIEYTLGLAKRLGYAGVVIFGDPDYYKRFGFVSAKEFGITDSDGKFPIAMQAMELTEGAHKIVGGEYQMMFDYNPDPKEFEQFDTQFPHKDKIEGIPSQMRFQEVCSAYL